MFTATSSGIPTGSYVVQFTNYEESQHPEYGDRVRWEFEVVEGPLTGQQTSRFTSAKLTQKSAFGKVIFKGMVGRQVEPGENFDPTPYIGKRFLAVVAETDSGSTRVETLLPQEAPAAPATPAAAAPAAAPAAPATPAGDVPF